MIKIKKKTFSGTSKVFDGELAQAIRGVAQYQAAVKLDTAAVTALTNSAGGTANGTINAIGNVTPAVLGTTDCAQKAGFETALVTVKDAISEIVAKLNAIRAVVPAFPALTDSTGGATADGTVGAIGVALTGVGTSLASAAGSQAVVNALKDAISPGPLLHEPRGRIGRRHPAGRQFRPCRPGRHDVRGDQHQHRHGGHRRQPLDGQRGGQGDGRRGGPHRAA